MKICIIGGTGYIGSRLRQELSAHHSVITIDAEWWGNPSGHPNIKRKLQDIHSSDLEDCDVVILLAGHSSVQMSSIFPVVWENNVDAFVKLIHKLNNKQRLIYASSSSVYGNCTRTWACETDPLDAPLNPYDHSKQLIDRITQDHYYKETILDAIPKLSGTRDIWGLRFGTVCGYSDNFRPDVMINAMWHSAKVNNCVNVYNGDTRRSILGINDLCAAIKQIVEQGRDPKIYNLASFASTSLQIGQTVADLMGVELRTPPAPTQGNEKLLRKTYDFWVDTQSFEKDFNFKFNDTIHSIVNDINMGWSQARLSGIEPSTKYRDRCIHD